MNKSIKNLTLALAFLAVSAFPAFAACTVTLTPSTIPADTDTTVHVTADNFPSTSGDRLTIATDADQDHSVGIVSFSTPSGCTFTSANGFWDEFSCGHNTTTMAADAVFNFHAGYNYNNNGINTHGIGFQDLTTNYYDCQTSITITPSNQPPTVEPITVSTNPVQINNSTTASANFTDPNTSDTHTTSWDWGDGNTTIGTVTESSGSGSVSDSHTYSTAGVYTVTLIVTDNHGATGQAEYQYVSVYNPTSQGLFSAGQHFSSPAGAYSANSSLTGTVKFGLAYKYQGTMPTSDRQFTMNFPAASLTFNARSISALVISNSMATLTGTGTLNGGSSSYNFLVTGVNGGDIRIQITDPSNNNAVIYDTQPNDTATATPTTSVNGNVIVHN